MPYLPYLPRDSPEDPDYDHCTSILVHDLGVASRLEVGELYRTAHGDPGLVELLRSYVILAPRFYEADHDPRACALVLGILSKLFASPPPARDSTLGPLLHVDVLLETAALIGYLPKGTSVVSSMIKAAPDLPRLLPVAVRHLSWSMLRAAEQVAAKLQRSVNSIEEAVIPLSGIRSTLLTLRAFLPACPGALLQQLCRGEDLFACLGLVHDQLCPALGSVLSVFEDHESDRTPSASALSQARTVAAQIEIASGSLAVLLLQQGILNCDNDEEEEEEAGPSSSGTNGSAMAAGAVFVEAIQSLVSSAPDGCFSRSHQGLGVPTLANAMVDIHGLGGALSRAQDSGRIYLDDAQIDYLGALLPGVWSTSRNSTAQVSASEVSAPQKPAQSPSAWQPGALQAGSVQTVRELLPDLGPGFVAACLDAVGGQPEAAIAAILDGSVPPAVDALGRDAGWEAYAAFIGVSTGNGASGEASKNEINQNVTHANKNPPRPAAGTVKSGSSKWFLDVREGGLRRQLQARAREAQWEYEDEYDDSLEHDVMLGARDINEEDEMPDIASRLHLGGGEQQPLPSRNPTTVSAPARNKDKKGPGFRQWVLDGRVYNYKKEGAVQATSAEHARQLVADAAAKKEEIYGLGRGGNVPLQADSASEPEEQRIRGAPGTSQGAQPPRDRRRKEQHKSGVANHHRKDRAAQKLQRAS